MTEIDIRPTVAVNPDSKKEDRMKTVKMVTECTVGSLVEIFMTAVTNSIVKMVGGSKLANLGIRAGGFLVGLWIGDQVSTQVCNYIEETANVLEDVKKTIENGGAV